MHSDDLVVDTSYGPVRGVSGDSIDVWKGIAYARPPVHELRWRHAVEPAYHADVVPADAFGPVCPQPVMQVIELADGARQEEDCLYLNVATPRGAAASDAELPVMVWIHGGAYLCGAGSQPMYNPVSLITTGNSAGTPTVIVTVNYRMGAFGFTDLSAWSTADQTYEANCGMSDVLAALRWVNRNIAGFGGDPSNVTVFGESAGGGIVTTLLTMPDAEGLVHRAIAQSSPATSVYGRERAEKHAEITLAPLPQEKVRPGMLRNVPAGPLVAGSQRAFLTVPRDFPGTIAHTPVIDGDLIPDDPLHVYDADASLPVPLLIGTNRHETSLFKWMSSPLMPVKSEHVDAMFAHIGTEQPDLPLPEPDHLDESYQHVKASVRSMAISRDIGFRMPALWIAEAHNRQAPVHLYRFDWATPLLRFIGFGAAHATELPYVWGNPASTKRDPMYRLGGRQTGDEVCRRVQRRWLNFAASGDPRVGDGSDRGGAVWESYTDDRHASLRIGAEDTAALGLDDAMLQAWGEEALSFR
ncbi:carboxylesterase/lipase family protein [Gordonia sp. HY002]|uniref:carboxylesterase/lipase family protein n=1 Tax=Gordonia zhenghanii TaxID=2911516 RepID=UPI001EF024F7|nr:carboxylesterase/lipase family protein [Gordonia zhenghanii]MCF8569017.1 carboxylesterase/lipase family protein [Gordonia zhenghanii]MCF8606341.1 carboxylesterase/lipase family protein [Gordonia zhenghanii]